MGSINTNMCCGENLPSERYPESLHPLESMSYRANPVHSDKHLESIQYCNSKPHEIDEMDKINKLLDIAENRIITLNSATRSESGIIVQAKNLFKQEKKQKIPLKIISSKKKNENTSKYVKF